ncbi:9-O-acetylesterase [Solitalea longa]|uniref:9-O-acetylesterase n=1 Tax=Solitalea longa TaxID=2079460 RepID=A0A2S5A274_9SPHI|nr:sialate O-acetylesterase [Solitalea longa]POY36655.1 9-O-acetylesterase [Solitalea longa]
MKKAALLFVLSVFACTLKAEVKLPALVGDHMVLQRDKPLNIWGYANSGEAVTINFANKTVKTTTAANGKWTAVLPAMKAGGPYQMKIKGTNEILLNDILIGDVWICSGQSNMDFPLKDASNGTVAVEKSVNNQIRLFTVEKKIFLQPQEEARGQWSVCSPETTKWFTAVGYFFGKELNQKLNIPIGLIHSCWGGTVVESWISADGLKGETTFGNKALQTATFDTLSYNNEHRKLNDTWMNKFDNSDIGKVGGKYVWADNDINTSDWKPIQLPIVWEFLGKGVFEYLDGVVWFRKQFSLKPEDLKSDCVASLGYIQNSDVTFVNGTQIGSSPDKWGLMRNYTIPKNLLKEGQNTITVRVNNYGGDGGFAAKSADFYIKTNNATISLIGEWLYKVGYTLKVYDRPEKEFGPNTSPSVLYNSMINPLVNLSIKGVIWYQGESNWDRGYQYRDLFPRMITDWRSQFKQGEFPFLFVQLANHHQKQDKPENAYWAEVREAQDMTLKLNNTGMVTAIDLGNAGNIHPTNKQDVGLRLAWEAERTVYKVSQIGPGPRFKSVEFKEGYALIKFDNVGNGLKLKEKTSWLGGFAIAGANQQFVWSEAIIVDKNTVKVYQNNIKQPEAVRYAWEDNPADASLYSSDNLPAFPFRTDNWKGITAENR